MNTSLAFIISLVMGSVLIINGMAVNADDILDSTQVVVNNANVHQLHTALELYYLDNNFYPDVSGGEALVLELEQKGYFRTPPGRPEAFNYEPLDNGQDYLLALQ